MKKQTKNISIISAVIVGIILLVGIGAYYYSSNTTLSSQSILSISSIYLDNGKVYWDYNGVADSIDEGVTFTNKPSTYTMQDGSGTTVTPQKSLSITITKQSGKCEYALYQTSKWIYGELWEYKYYTLQSPRRIAEIKITDGNGGTTILDGAVKDTAKTITDSDGKGGVTIKAVGVISSAYDCPEKDSVAVIKDSKGRNKYVNRYDLENKLQDESGVLSIVKQLQSPALQYFLDFLFGSSTLRLPTDFILELNGPTLDMINMRVIGERDIGNGQFTITADQDYYNSVIYTPPTQADPEITNINVGDSIKGGSTIPMSISIKNNAGTTGVVLLTATSENSGITPKSISFTLATTSTQYFTLTASETIGDGKVCFKACSTGQFGTPSCNEKCKNFEITGDDIVTCGNGKVEGTEQCDDGNLFGGDGCSSNCKLENVTCLLSKCEDCGTIFGLGCSKDICDACNSKLGCNYTAGFLGLTGTCKTPDNYCANCWDWLVKTKNERGQECQEKTVFGNSLSKIFGLEIKQGVWCPIEIGLLIILIAIVGAIIWIAIAVGKGEKRKK